MTPDQIKEAAEKYAESISPSPVQYVPFYYNKEWNDAKNSFIAGAEYALSLVENPKQKITLATFKELGFEGEGGFCDHTRKFGTCVVTLRLNAGHCYCEMPNLYIGEIENVHRLKSFLFGLTGREEFKSPF